MDVLSLLLDGFTVALTPTNIGLALFGCFIGTIVGALPGLGPINGVAILIPMAFSLKLAPEIGADPAVLRILRLHVWRSYLFDYAQYSRR